MPEFKFLGKRSTEPSKELDTFPAPATVSLVKFESDELTSFCPVTGQPDFSQLVLEYAPNELCIESKSLKLYLWTFREAHIFGEGLAHQIVEDVMAAIRPQWCKVTLTQNIRGGLRLTATAQKSADDI